MVNKKKLLLLFLISIGQTVFSQSNAEQIMVIRNAYRNINNDSSLKIILIDDTEAFLGHATDGGGELRGFYKADSIYKMEVTIGLSFGEVFEEYYLKNGQLIFAYSAERHFGFDSKNNIDYKKLNPVFEGRYYFYNDSLIKQVVKGKKLSTSIASLGKDLLANAKAYNNLLNEKLKQRLSTTSE